MHGLDSSTSLSPRVIIGRFPPALAAAAPQGPPTPLLGDLLAEVITHQPALRSQIKARGELQCYLRWLCDAPALGLPHDPLTLRGQADPLDVPHALDRLRAVSEGDITAYLRTLGRGHRNLAHSSINGRLTVLRCLYRRLIRHGLVDTSPLADIRSHPLPQTSRTAWMSAAQARALIDSCQGTAPKDVRDRAIVTLMLYTGLRGTEARLLRAEDLEEAGGHRIARVTGKGEQRERVKIVAVAGAALDAWLTLSGITTGIIFRSLHRHKGQDIALSEHGFRSIITTRIARAGLPANLVPHSLRHTFITLAIAGGASLPLVQYAARHRNPQTTMRYAHGLDGLDHNAVDYIEL